MKHRQGDIQPRQQQPQDQGPIAQNPQEGGAEVVPAPILRALHQVAQVRRGQIAQGQAVHQQSHPPLQEPGAEFIRPLRVLNQGKGRLPGTGDVLLHSGGSQEAVHIDLFQAMLHPLHQAKVRQAVNVGHGHIGQAPAAHLGLPKPQGRGAQMAADEAGIGPNRLHEGILGTLDGILHLRGGDAPLLPGFNLKGNGPGPGEENDAEAVDQLQCHSVQVPAGVRHAVINAPPEGRCIERLDGIPPQIIRNGLYHILRGIRPGGQAVDGIGIEGEFSAFQGTDDKVPGIPENMPDIWIGDLAEVHSLHLFGRVPGDRGFYTLSFFLAWYLQLYLHFSGNYAMFLVHKKRGGRLCSFICL